MQITILGAGSIIPVPIQYRKRSNSAILVELGKEKLLFDCRRARCENASP